MKTLTCTLVLLLCTVVTRQLHAQPLLQRSYQPSFSEGKIRAFFKDIRKQTGVDISFSESVLDSRQKVTVKGTEKTVDQVLRTLLAGLPLTWLERPDKILIIPATGSDVAPAPVEKITLSGFIRDSSSSEVLIGATVYIPAIGAGTATNAYGFYSLTVPAGSYEIMVSYIGYRKTWMRTTGGRRDVLLAADDGGIAEIAVVAPKDKPSDHIQLTAAGINKYATPLGDNDVMRALQHYPGVQPSNDGTISMNVRGGDPSHNLCMLDGVPIYHIDHFISISSIYNTEALKTTDFYTGAFPSRYGGRLASVIDIYTKDGDMEHYGGSAKLGLMNGSASVEGPLIKRKVSMIVSARRSWVDLVQRFLDTTKVNLDFYDINAKINYQMNPSNRFYISVYKGQDRFGAGDENDPHSFLLRTTWGNTFVAARWTSVLSPKFFINTTATLSNFRYKMDAPFFLTDSALTTVNSHAVSSIREASFRSQLSWYLSTKHKIETGLQYAHAGFNPASVTLADGTPVGINAIAPSTNFASNEVVAYAEDEWKPLSGLRIRLGLHLAYWANQDFSYPVLQPRLHINYRLGPALSVYASATRMAQFLHRTDNFRIGLPTEFWLPSTARIRPESAWMGNIGVRSQSDDGVSFSVEAYYKKQNNLIANSGNAGILSDGNPWESKLTQGTGTSYGLECSADKQIGHVSLSVVYTLSKTDRQFNELFGGATVPYKYDRRHNLHLDGIWQISKSFNFTANWTYMSGSFITLPDQEYPDPDNNILNSTWNYSSAMNYTQLNNYRLPSIHRLDMALNFTRRKGRHHERTLTVGIFNAYGRRNILSAYLTRDEATETYKLETISIGRFVPTISYRVQF